MENSNLNLNKIKAMLRDSVVRTILVSFATILVTLGIVVLLMWHYRGELFKLLAKNKELLTLLSIISFFRFVVQRLSAIPAPAK